MAGTYNIAPASVACGTDTSTTYVADPNDRIAKLEKRVEGLEEANRLLRKLIQERDITDLACEKE